MAQIKISSIKDHLNPIKLGLSDVIHSCVVDALQFPADKRAHRFFAMHKEDMIYPSDRADTYTILETVFMKIRRPIGDSVGYMEMKPSLITKLMFRYCHV
jgi:hypothetical protein